MEVHSEIEIAEYSGSRRPRSSNAGDQVASELGIWLSGIESFLASGHHFFLLDSDRSRHDSSREFRLLHSALQKSALLANRLLASDAADRFDAREVSALTCTLRELLPLSGALIAAPSPGAGEWRAWTTLLSARFSQLPAFRGLIRTAEDEGLAELPEMLRELTAKREFLSAEHSELALILPRFGLILKWLSVVGRMLDTDEPLKPSLVIFARVNEQIHELTTYINSRLERFPNEDAEIFGALDAASYTASIELKKVYSQELAGVAHIRPTPSIYARVETAYSLLSEGFQQMLAGLARSVDPECDIFELFPTFQIKLEQSIALRQELWDAARVVQAAEAKPAKAEIEKMQAELRRFLKETVRFLFYKDTETVERFAEEIFITKQNKDLVPLLHRFGAYLETLFGQVSLRAVLEKHPFDPKAG